jgi:tetratricopeptide (TPR) repeat protein/predicted Ser/Thr protein kinase
LPDNKSSPLSDPKGLKAAITTGGLAGPDPPSKLPSGEELTLDAGSAWPTAQGVSAGGSEASVAFAPGAIIAGRYEILQALGEGGMGTVYKAKDRELDRIVAVKTIRPELASNPAIIKRFKQELILARQVTHRNVVRIYDLGEADGVKFITMEYIEGRDLTSLLREKGKLAPKEAAEIMEQVCRALEAAHMEGVVHRDLKPQNIMIDAHGKVSVMDFGIARSTEVAAEAMTYTGAIIGTPQYMSPEQARGEKLDARSDLFSFGIVFYEMLTGNSPYKADTVMSSLYKRTNEAARPAIELVPEIPRGLSEMVSKCLDRDLALRYQNAGEIIADLDAWWGKRPTLASLPVSVPGTRRVLAWKWIAAAAAAVLLLVGTQIVVQRLTHKTPAQHAPVSVLVADFTNHTGDPIFDDTLEPMFNVALEGASFVNAFSRGTARKLAQKLPHPTDKLDEQAARLVAVGQGISAVITGELGRRGDSYSISAIALDSVTGNVLAKTEVTAANKDEVLLAIPKLAGPIRTALGDTTPESVQVEKARGALSAASLEAVHQYGVAMEQLNAGNMEEALRSFSNAVALDPNFARAYGGRAAASGNLGKTQDAEKDLKLAMEHVDRMTDRERYRIRGVYYYTTRNWQKCVEELSELVSRFPADNFGQSELAGCYLYLHDFPKAVAAMRRAVEIVPKGALQRVALSLYSSYNGDFAGGEREARAALGLNPSFLAYLALAEAQLGLGQMSQATETYHKLEKVSVLGASLAASGLADMASFEGRYADAVRILERGAAADLAAKNPDNAAEKIAALAHIQVLRGQKGPAVAAATKASAMSQDVPVRVLAAQTFVEVGEIAKAQKLAAGLGSELQAEPQAYAKIIEGESALKQGDSRQAIKAFTEADNLLDTWIGHYELARAYLEAGAFVEADGEIDRCVKRRGEALELFMDNVPTIGYFPPVYYLQGRVREGLKSAGFAESYRNYLGIRGQAGEDPLLPEIHRRLGEQGSIKSR